MAGKILKVAWLSVLLGIGMELLLLAVAAGAGTVPAVKPIVADLVQKVSWSLFVCAGLACGTAASKTREAAMGLAGMITAPAAFQAARALHKSTLEALAIAGPAGGVPSPLTLAFLKAVEYGCLGIALGAIEKRGVGAKVYGLVGLVTGLVFAGIVVGLVVTSSPKPPAAAALVSRAVNELAFPIGCSLVLFATTAAGNAARGSSTPR